VQKVLNEKELEGRTDVRFDNYTKRIQIESRVIGDIAINQIVPGAIVYQTRLIDNVKGLKEIFGQNEYKTLAGARLELIRNISEHITAIKAKVHDMNEARKIANKINEARDKASQYATTVLPYLEEIRYHIDKLEEIMDNELWPLPKYRELLFSR
jgi:glutamine synthetase